MRLAFVVLSALVALVSALMAVSMKAPSTPLALAAADALPLAGPRLVEASAIAGDPRRAGELPRALADLAAARAIAPDRLAVTLVEVDVLTARNGGHAGPDALKALRRSYDQSPLSYGFAAGRLRYAYAHWRELTPELRALASAEYRCVWTVAPGELEPIAFAVPNLPGRIAALSDLVAARRANPVCRPRAPHA